MPQPQKMDLDGLDVLVDLQTGAISIVVPTGDGAAEDEEPLEIGTYTADDEYAPQE